jgi:hypothetical protein
MKTLIEKIMTIYPSLTFSDFEPNGTIYLRNDGQGDYIAAWNNTIYAQPTAAQLAAIT